MLIRGEEEILREEPHQNRKKALELIKNKKSQDKTKQIISLLESENIDFDLLKKFIEQREKTYSK